MSKRNGGGNVRRIREAAEAASSKDQTVDAIPSRLSVREDWGRHRGAHEGPLSRKPWEYPVCAVIPTCGAPELTALCLAFIAKQTVPIYTLLIDTGSSPAELERLETLRGPAVEVHRIAGHGWRHSSEVVGAAMAFGATINRSAEMLAIHSDAFLINPKAVEELQAKNGLGLRAVGYTQTRANRGEDFLSHSTTLLPTHEDIPWDRNAYFRKHSGDGDEWDTEFGLNACGLPCGSVGEDRGEPDADGLRIHLSAATSAIRHGGLDQPRRDLLARAIHKAAEIDAPMPAWAWQPLYALADARPIGRKFEPVPWAPNRGGDVVTFVAPFYQYDPILLDSLARQTVGDWRLVLLHDGPMPESLRLSIRRRAMGNGQIVVRETPERFNDYGHSLRQIGLNFVAKGAVEADWIVITNGDNYYVPGFVEMMLAAVKSGPYKAAVCDMVHNYWNWRTIRSCFTHGEIDCGAVMVERETAIDAGWRSREVAADWVYIRDVLERIGAKAFAKVDRSAFIHN